MNTPPLLLAMALVFWGQQTGMLLLAVPIALSGCQKSMLFF